MLTTSELLAAAKAAQGNCSYYRLARLMDVPERTMSRWSSGKNAPDDVHAARLAELAGLDPAEVVASINAERATEPAMRELWRAMAQRLHAASLAALAVILSLWIGGGPDGSAMAATPGSVNGGQLCVTALTVYTLARVWRWFRGFSRPGLWPMVHPCCT